MKTQVPNGLLSPAEIAAAKRALAKSYGSVMNARVTSHGSASAEGAAGVARASAKGYGPVLHPHVARHALSPADAAQLVAAVKRAFGQGDESILASILLENIGVLRKTDEDVLSVLVRLIGQARDVFVAGKGRSGLVARCFAMRLMHLGISSYVLDETVTPATHEDDLLVVFSASGETEDVCVAAEKARNVGAKTVAVTTNPESRLGRTARMNVVLPAQSKRSHILSGSLMVPRFAADKETGQFAGTLFEQSALLFSDAVILQAMREWNIGWDELASRHANLE